MGIYNEKASLTLMVMKIFMVFIVIGVVNIATTKERLNNSTTNTVLKNEIIYTMF